MLILGIDCSQLKHAYCLLEASGRVLAEGEFAETRSGLQQLRERVEGKGQPGLVVMEASGNYWQNLHAELANWGWHPTAVDPQGAAQFTRWQSPRHKTDKASARDLARLGLQGTKASQASGEAGTLAHGLARASQQRTLYANQLHALLVIANPALIACHWKLHKPRTLAVLTAYPTTVQLQRARNLAQIRYGSRGVVGASAAQTLQQASREALCGAVNAEHSTQILFLVEQIRTLNAELARLEEALAQLLPDALRLTSIPGVGRRTALLLCACVPLAQLPSAKAAAAFVGLHPHLFQSGQSSWTRLSKRGDAIARAALYCAALPAIQHNPLFSQFYERLRTRGLAAKQALCAVAHKLVRICYALMRHQSTFLPLQLKEST